MIALELALQMRIHEVAIENFRRVEKACFAFCEPGTDSPRRLSVLVGPNMSGKTTVLDAIHFAFEIVSNLDSPKLRPDLDLDSASLRPDPQLPIRIRLKFSLHADEFSAIQELTTTLRDPALPVSPIYEVALRWPPKEGVPKIAGVLESASPWGANFALRGRALARVAKGRRLVAESIFERVGGVLYLDQHRSVNLAVPSVRTASEEDLRESARSHDVLPWLELQSRLHEKWDTSSQGQSSWSRIRDRFAELAWPSEIDDIKAFDDGFDLRFREGSRHYYSAGLSYGQSQILRFVTNLTAFRATRSVILVDEVELHLHPSWQRKLLYFLRGGGGDDNQFIVTTHSESIAKYVHPAEIVKLGDLDELG